MSVKRWMLYKGAPRRCNATFDGNTVFVTHDYTRGKAEIRDVTQVFLSEKEAITSQKGRMLWVCTGSGYGTGAPQVRRLKVYYINRGQAYCADPQDENEIVHAYHAFETRTEALAAAARIIAERKDLLPLKERRRQVEQKYQEALDSIAREAALWKRIRGQLRSAKIEIPKKACG